MHASVAGARQLVVHISCSTALIQYITHVPLIVRSLMCDMPATGGL